VEAVQSARLSVDQPGIVNAILVSAGTPVNKGDPLLQIDQRDLALQVERMVQNVTSKEVKLEALLNGASASDIASAEAAVQSAQAVQNLLDNALQHTPNGGQIKVTVKQENGGIQIKIRDNGDGISPDILPQVFDRLYRGDTARQRQGSSTGLGLAISKALIVAHMGTITAESRGRGQGSTFTIALPL
jgi:two-component system, OmpR family, sensor histidine kinase BaeS